MCPAITSSRVPQIFWKYCTHKRNHDRETICLRTAGPVKSSTKRPYINLWGQWIPSHASLIIRCKTRKTAQLLLRKKPNKDHVIYLDTCNSEGCGPHSNKTLRQESNRKGVPSVTQQMEPSRITTTSTSHEKSGGKCNIMDRERKTDAALHSSKPYILQTVNSQVNDLQILHSAKRHEA